MAENDWVALSIRQPWAEMIFAGLKTMEVRKWEIKRRGPVLIHVASGVDWKSAHLFRYGSAHNLTRGAVAGYAEIRDVIKLSRQTWLENIYRHRVIHPLVEGYYGAVLENVRRFDEPIRCRGRLGFFPLSPKVLQRALQQMEGWRD